ncbi:unnamed protein product [Ectocarpus sp. 8 AP-2014]
MFSRVRTPAAPPPGQGDQDGGSTSSNQGGGGGGWMSNIFGRVMVKVEEAISPRVVQPSEGSGSKSWACSSGVISSLTHFERISLNAMEERVLPPEIRLKIVFAQANAVEEEEERLEADVERLDGLVRTLALYGILERNSMDSTTSDKLTPDRERELGKMLVAAVQLELFRMLDDICEAGDVENELFDDLCADTIQDGRRLGFIFMTVELLLSPGSGYKRLLQLRKDQILEEIADVAGLRSLGGHDCQRSSSESSARGSPSHEPRKRVAAMDSDCGSPGSAAGGPGLQIAGGNRSASANLDEKSPSPSSPRPDSSRSPSPENGHRRTQTQRVRDLLSSIDGLVQESEEALTGMPSLAPNGPNENGAAAAAAAAAGRGSAPSRSVRGFKRQSTGAVDSRSGPSSRLSLRTPPPLDGEGDGSSHSDRAFFPNERDWRGSRFGSATTPPPELAAARRASVVPAAPGAEEEDDPASADMLLAEVDWLIAGTNAALGVGNTKDTLEETPDKRGASPKTGGVSESPEATLSGREGGEGVGGDLIGIDGLEITPDKRELSPKRHDAPESADATRVAGEARMEEEGEASLPDEEASPAALGVVQKALGEGGIGAEDSADEQRAGSPLPSSEAALTSSPSPETRVSGSSPDSAEKTALVSLPPTEAGSLEGDDDGAGVVPDPDDGAGVPPSEEEPAVGAGGSVEGGGDQGEQPADDVTAKSSSDGEPAADGAPGDVSDHVRTGQEKEEEEKSEKPALDAVVEPSVASGVRQEGEQDGGVALGAGIERGSLDPSQEEVGDIGRGEPAVPEADEEGATPSEAAGVRQQGGATVTLSSTSAAGTSSGSGADDSTGGLKESAAETEFSREMGRGSAGGGPSPLVVEAEVEAVSAGEDTQSVVISGHGPENGIENGIQNGLQKGPLGNSSEQGGGGSVLVANGPGAEEEAQVPVFEEIEL